MRYDIKLGPMDHQTYLTGLATLPCVRHVP